LTKNIGRVGKMGLGEIESTVSVNSASQATNRTGKGGGKVEQTGAARIRPFCAISTISYRKLGEESPKLEGNMKERALSIITSVKKLGRVGERA